MRILGHGLLLGLLMSQAVQGNQNAALAEGTDPQTTERSGGNASESGNTHTQTETEKSSLGEGYRTVPEDSHVGTPSSSSSDGVGNGSVDAASSMRPSTTNNRTTDSSFNGTSTPSGHGTEGKVCIELHFLIAGAVGIGLVSAVIAFHVSFFFKQGCKGKKKKQGQEEDQVSTQYASLQNLPIKGGDASRGPEQDAEKKTCYATIADIMSEPSPTKEKDTDGGSLTENP